MKKTTYAVSCAMTLIMLSGCITRQKTTQLERVAKDWCLTIRASQVIPVYPLTEDLQPGDVFLVQVPIGKQQEIYKDKGFLPLDNHLARLNPISYASFYSNSFLHGKITDFTLPYDWIRPGGIVTNSWGLAPHASFPSYSFSVRSGQGMNLAVPVQGVPVGLSLLNSDAADGTVSIKAGHTLGVDIVSLFDSAQSWASSNRVLLMKYGMAEGEQPNYLRVVTRVYAVGAMDVSLRDASTRSGGLDIGAAKPVNLLFPRLPDGSTNNSDATTQNYTNGIATVNAGLLASLAKDAAGNFLPGGSVRVTAAGSRTISMREDFSPPLVLGYLGFDCLILSDGRLGEPIPTYAILQGDVQYAKVKKFNNNLKEQIEVYKQIAEAYDQANDEKKEKIRELAMGQKITLDCNDPEWAKKLGVLVDGNDTAKLIKFQALLRQIQQLK